MPGEPNVAPHEEQGPYESEGLMKRRDTALRDCEVSLDRLRSRLEERLSFMVLREEHLHATEQALQKAAVLAAERLSALQDEREIRTNIENRYANCFALLVVEREMRKE